MPIYWTHQAISFLLERIDSAEPGQALGPEERQIYQRFKFPKRRMEWLGARLAAKDLVRRVAPAWAGLDLARIEVLNQAEGAPFLSVDGKRQDDVTLSLSHAHGHVLCTYADEATPMGADLEFIEARDPTFATDYFTGREIAQLNHAPADERALGETILWSGKEAVLKALRTGLRVDTRAVEIDLLSGTPTRDRWTSAEIRSDLIQKGSLRLVWRREGSFVLTVCARPAFIEQLTQVG